MRKSILSVALLAVIVVASARASESIFPLDRPAKDPTTAVQLIGESGVRILSEADDVQWFILDPDPEVKGEGDRIAGYRIVRGTAPHAPLNQKMTAELLNDENYDWSKFGGSKWCGGFQPRLAVQFTREKEVAVALICFECDDVAFLVRDVNGKKKHATLIDSWPGRPRLIRLAKLVFPEDKALKATEEKTRREKLDGSTEVQKD